METDSQFSVELKPHIQYCTGFATQPWALRIMGRPGGVVLSVGVCNYIWLNVIGLSDLC